MADKKDNDKFNNPFSALKGLSVSGAAKPEKKTAPQPVRPVEEPQPAIETDADFFTEMAGLGVRKIERSGLEKKAPQRETIDVSSAAEESAVRTGSGSGVAQARRDKRLKRGDLQPQAELDLHGVTAAEVQQKVAWFLENSRFYGFEAVRIITGKGSRSEEGPVLRPLVEEYLDGPGRTYVVEWLRAPQKQGGGGAIIAFLRI